MKTFLLMPMLYKKSKTSTSITIMMISSIMIISYQSNQSKINPIQLMSLMIFSGGILASFSFMASFLMQKSKTNNMMMSSIFPITMFVLSNEITKLNTSKLTTKNHMNTKFNEITILSSMVTLFILEMNKNCLSLSKPMKSSSSKKQN